MRTSVLVVLLLAVCGLDSLAAEKKEAKWDLVKDEKGVKVYLRKVKGIDFKEFKGVITIKSSLASLVALVSDVEASPGWLANCSKSEVLKRLSPQETYVYSLSKAPWPVQNRDAIVHHVISQDKDTRVVTVKQTGKPDYIEKKKRTARVKKADGFWRFTPLENGQVEVVYQVLSDPGGDLPAWLVNSSLASQPYQTLLKMEKEVQREKYRNAVLAFILE